MKHEKFMNASIKEAKKALREGEVPVGAVIVVSNNIISSAFNQSISHADPTAHAEILAIRKACKSIGNYRLSSASIYTTLEPCAMCYGAIVHARISNLVFGAYDSKTGVCGSSFNLHEKEFFNHTPKIIGGVLEKDCSTMLKDFFKGRRN